MTGKIAFAFLLTYATLFLATLAVPVTDSEYDKYPLSVRKCAVKCPANTGIGAVCITDGKTSSSVSLEKFVCLNRCGAGQLCTQLI